jgi:hypothetical protein
LDAKDHTFNCPLCTDFHFNGQYFRATEWNLYGSARVATFYAHDLDPSRAPLGLTETDLLQWEFQPNSRFGANVRGEVIDGRMEIGANDPVASLRLLYGVWKFSND